MDLQELEILVDAALEKETPESMSNWLAERRFLYETSGGQVNDSKHNVKKLLNCESCIDVGNLTGTQRCGVCKNYDKYRAI